MPIDEQKTKSGTFNHYKNNLIPLLNCGLLLMVGIKINFQMREQTGTLLIDVSRIGNFLVIIKEVFLQMSFVIILIFWEVN